ncbi:MAG TPA: VWA domain-containing protein [Candidatus Norongarragalinales archaeon]|nr:VWA domain-containing protein [Candidatus Norongarragalinales archaeon]
MVEILFTRPAFLWFLALLPVLVIIHFYSLRHVERKALLFANYKAMRRITGGEPVPKNYLLLAMRLVILAAFILAAAGATLLTEIPASTYDLIIAVDASSSMAAQDFKPTRLNATLEQAKDYVLKLPEGTRVGVVYFSSTAILLNDPSGSNKAEAVESLNAIKATRFGGTALGDAILAGTNALLNSDRPKAIIILTDGKSNTGVRPDDAARYAAQTSTEILAIGIAGGNANASSGGADMHTLRVIANETKGRAFEANDEAELEKAFQDLAIEASRIKQPLELALPLMAIAFLLVFIDWSLSSTRYRIIP